MSCHFDGHGLSTSCHMYKISMYVYLYIYIYIYNNNKKICPIMFQDIVHRVQIITDTSGLVSRRYT